MKNILIIIIAVFFASNIFAQTETRELEGFTSLKVRNALEVRLVQGQKNEAVISVPESKVKDMSNIKTEIIDGVLSIYREGKVKSKNNIVVILTFKHINKVTQSGASEILTLNVIKEDHLEVIGSGAIEAGLNVEVNKLIIDFSGASDLKLKGSADYFELKATGASDIKASNFIVKNIIVNLAGASDVKVHATESIKGTATGASSVSIKGNPKTRLINKSGASSTSYGNNKITTHYNDDVSIKAGKQHLDVIDEDVDLKLGNKGVVVKDDGDTVRLKWGATELIVIDDSVELKRNPKKRRSHWAGLDLGINGFLDANNSFDLSNPSHFEQTSPEKVTQFMELNYAKSWSFSINFMEFYFPIKKHNFGFVTGMGTEWNNYELKHNIKLTSQGGAFVHPSENEFNSDYTWGEVDTVLSYSKNRFKTWFVNVPLLFEINTGDNAKKAFHVCAGAIVGYNLQTKIKYQYTLNNDDKTDKDKQRFNTNPFRVSATIRAGYGWFNVFATYSLTPLFQNGRGPKLYPFTVGVTLLGF